MAGTLTISTLSDGTNSTSSTNCIQGSAKAWVNFDGLTGSGNTIRSSYNVSSITRTSTGVFTVALTNALADANYCSVFNSSPALADNSTRTYNAYAFAISSSVVGIDTFSNSVFESYANINVAIFR